MFAANLKKHLVQKYLKVKYIFLISTLIALSCHSGHKVYLKGKEYHVSTPPNTVQISNNFFADETEITNINYKEYLYWLNKVFGSESKEYQTALPDTLVWRNRIEFGEPYISNYLRHPAYDDYPIVGVNLQQAKNYTAWRTERIAESLLISKGLIKENRNENINNYFKIDRYVHGDFDWIIKKESTVIPVYKVPTIKEWKKIAGIESKFKYGTDNSSKYNRRTHKRYKCLYNTKDFDSPTRSKKHYRITNMPNATRTLSKNIYDLYEIIGNVAELVDSANIVKGGSW